MRNEKRSAKWTLTERTLVCVTLVFRVISEVKGRHPEGKRTSPGRAVRSVAMAPEQQRHVESKWNAMQTEGVGGGGNMHCVSSLRLAVCLRSLFPFDQRRGVCAEDNKLQLLALVNQGLPNTRWHRSARVFFKILWWEWISPLMVYICIVENHRAPVRMTWLLDDECLFSKRVIHTEGYYFTKSSFPYRIAHVQTESSIFGEIRNLLSKTFLFSLCEQSQMFLRNAGWENTTNGNFGACSIEALESDIVFCLWFFF